MGSQQRDRDLRGEAGCSAVSFQHLLKPHVIRCDVERRSEPGQVKGQPQWPLDHVRGRRAQQRDLCRGATVWCSDFTFQPLGLTSEGLKPHRIVTRSRLLKQPEPGRRRPLL